jgi:hypothetical protein
MASGIKFDDYVNMVRKSAHFYAKKYRMEYDDIEAQGFWVYSLCVQNHNPAKASFSTMLYQNLESRLRDYCLNIIHKTILDRREPQEILSRFKARQSTDREEFLSYANDYLSPLAYKLLIWILDSQHGKPGSRKRPSILGATKYFSLKTEFIKPVWQELESFWTSKGAAFFGET